MFGANVIKKDKWLGHYTENLAIKSILHILLLLL